MHAYTYKIVDERVQSHKQYLEIEEVIINPDYIVHYHMSSNIRRWTTRFNALHLPTCLVKSTPG